MEKANKLTVIGMAVFTVGLAVESMDGKGFDTLSVAGLGLNVAGMLILLYVVLERDKNQGSEEN